MDNDSVYDVQSGQAQADALADKQYQVERDRIRHRRQQLKVDLEKDPGDPPSMIWGLALSGGGIRSATFGLGVLQAMARAKAPKARAIDSGDGTCKYLLPHIDYLSTVSGGGYIGAFYCSLFQGGRLRPYLGLSGQANDPTVVQAAVNAFDVLRFEPPGRIHSSVHYDISGNLHVGDAPTAWLRENGRYLTPSGSGDLFYGIALAVRNWLSVHFVIGMPILFVLAAMNVLLMYIKYYMPQTFLGEQLPELVMSLWLLPVSILLFRVLPLGLAFWLFYSTKSVETDSSRIINWAYAICLSVVISLSLVVSYFYGYLPHNLLSTFVLAIPVMIMAMLYGIWISKLPAVERRTVRDFRVNVTRRLAKSINFMLGVVFLVSAFELSHALYQWASTSPWLSLTPAAVLAGIVWLTRAVARLFDERSKKTSLLNLPLPYLAMPLGIAMLSLTLLSWGTLLHWMLAVECCWICSFANLWDAWILLGVVAPLVVITGIFIGFLNLSSLQALYSARLTRAYLGASNGFRFKWSDDRKTREEKLSVSEALPGDDLSLEDYYCCNSLAPLHLINVTVNLTSDMTGQLVQRDRKGLPLCIAPGSYCHGKSDTFSYSFIMDGVPRTRVKKTGNFSEVDQPLTLGHWIATSGAAFSTGLGRTTSLGASLVCGLANVRLGTWWPANFEEDDKPESQKNTRRDPWLARYLPTPYYLLKEFTAQFHGLRSEYQYLSDGGHFENTGVYELLRPGRRLELIVLCDCGADPEYRFEDMANLIRLARLDLKLEIEADTGYLQDNRFRSLQRVIGVYEDFLTGTAIKNDKNSSKMADDQCSLLFNVFDRDSDPRRLVCLLLVIKPNIITRLSDDVQFYSVTHPSFPNEPTIDQFFNESQFESYRQLGLNIGQLLFGSEGPKNSGPGGKKQKTYEATLWAYLNKRLKKIRKGAKH
ncbi:hypothetical protein [Pseudomonas moorei]|uniref:PNPLA domain-containing protein n=1 Tax=Pseudomonas moorei TaxID=395599 RepID=A0A1H1HDJ6_9PSED|nr:hypothetical protein [Pseudomonas moorei]KAB0494983.1 hypothetical protein F7R06_28675 [Pseudomonas moorei]SDR23547.1 hypothetical protein SAMN04490195_4036 [Pseudomonas moorei]